MAAAILTALAILLSTVVYLCRSRLVRLLIPKGLPGIPGYTDSRPVWGDIHRIKDSFENHGGYSHCFDSVAKDLGPIAQIRLGWFQTFVIVTDLPTIEHILVKQTKSLDRARQTTSIFKRLLPTGQIALPTNDMWKHHRRIVGPAMTSKYLGLATPLANQAVADLIDYIKAKAEAADGRAFEIEKDLEAGTIDAICAMAFGASWGVCKSFRDQVSSATPAIGGVGEAIFKLVDPPMLHSMLYLFSTVDQFSPFPLVSNYIASLKPAYRRHEARLNAYLKEKTKEARAQAQAKGAEAAVETATNTLDMMVARELKGEDWMSEAEMRDELYLFLLAGTETSATTLAWWCKYMTNHPEVQRKLRQHVIDRIPTIQDRQPTFDELNAANVPYLEAVVHESLRLSRTAGGYTREATEDVMILGQVVPKGTTVVFPTVTGLEDASTSVFKTGVDAGNDSASRNDSLNAIRDVDATRKVGYWEPGTAHQFMPERWLDKDGQFDINAGPSLPFSLGQRSCFGKNLALLELRLFISQLNQEFFFAPVAENQNSFVKFETVTSHPKQSLVKPVKWTESVTTSATTS